MFGRRLDVVNEGSSTSADDGGSDVPIISQMFAILARLPKKDIRVISVAIIIIAEE